MYIDIVPNRKSPPAILLREGKRIGDKVVKSTVANLTALGLAMARQVQLLLKGGQVVMPGEDNFVADAQNDFEAWLGWLPRKPPQSTPKMVSPCIRSRRYSVTWRPWRAWT